MMFSSRMSTIAPSPTLRVTAEADRMGYGSPADDRAWGPIFQRAARNKVIQRIGYGISKRRHLSPTPLWRSLVFGGNVA